MDNVKKLPTTWPAVDRRTDHVARAIKDINSRLDDGDVRMGTIETAVSDNTKLTQTVKTDTAEIIAAFKSLTGAMNTLETIGRTAKPLAILIGLISTGLSAWFTWKNHGS